MLRRNHYLTNKFTLAALVLLCAVAVSPSALAQQAGATKKKTHAPSVATREVKNSSSWGEVLPAPETKKGAAKKRPADEVILVSEASHALVAPAPPAASPASSSASNSPAVSPASSAQALPAPAASAPRLTSKASLRLARQAALRMGAQQPGGAPVSAPIVPAPSSNAPVQTTTAPSSIAPTTPATTQAGQQPSSGTPAPQTPAQSAPATSAPPSSQPQGSTVEATQGQTPASAPGTQVQPPQGVRLPGRESVPTGAPAEIPLDVPPVATDYRASSAPFPALERVGVAAGEQRALPLREALEMALANNTDIAVARQNVRVAEFDLQGARGVYDPRFSTFSYYERAETPTASFLSGGSGGAVTQSGFFGTASFQGLVPQGGGGYRVDFTSSRVTTNNQFTSLNPQYPSALTFNFTQPLLRGRRFDQNRRLIEIANSNLSLTDAQFRQRAIETITNVQRAYWDLVYSLRNLQIQRDAVRDARAQLEHNRRLVAEGMLAPIDVVAAEAQVSGFEQSVYSALDDVGRAENVLKNLIAENRESAIWNVALVPTDEVDLPPPAVVLPEAMSAALSNRPELKQSDVVRAINEIEQRFAREQTKTQVDIVASYGVVGLAGSLNAASGSNPLTGTLADLQARVNQLSLLNGLDELPGAQQQTFPDALVGGYPQSLLNLAANRFNNFRVGVQLNIPFRNRTAQAQLGRTLVERDRIATQREQLEQLIQVDVRNSLQLVKTAESRLRSAATARNASEQQYSSEQRKFDAGQSTFFLVLERQTALTTARGNELRAQTELNKAIAELQRATGNALEANRVEVRIR